MRTEGAGCEWKQKKSCNTRRAGHNSADGGGVVRPRSRDQRSVFSGWKVERSLCELHVRPVGLCGWDVLALWYDMLLERGSEIEAPASVVYALTREVSWTMTRPAFCNLKGGCSLMRPLFSTFSARDIRVAIVAAYARKMPLVLGQQCRSSLMEGGYESLKESLESLGVSRRLCEGYLAELAHCMSRI